MRFNQWAPSPDSIHQGTHRGEYAPEDGPLFSIITVTWNRLETIKRTMASVQAQTYKNYEFIIIDSASNDGSIDYFDNNKEIFDYYISEKDAGICDGINRGYSLAKGKFIYLLFSDDWIPENFLEEAAKSVENLPDDVGFIFGNCHTISLHGNSWVQVGDPNYHTKIRYMMPGINMPCLIMRKEMIEKTGFFDLDVDVPSDYDYLLRSHMAGWKGVYCPDLYSYFSKGGNSTIKELQGHREVFQIACRHAGFSLGAAFYYARNVCRYGIKVALSKIPPSIEDKAYALYHKWRS